MRDKDREVFKDVAREKNVWLLARLTNPKSLKWADEKNFGNDNYIPKPISCKAKTANNDTDKRYEIAGLVADPYHHRDNKFNKPVEARRYWDEFRTAHLAPDYEQTGTGRDGYSVDIDPASRHYFCVQRHGKYIHADYDLLDIINAENPRTDRIIEDFLDGAPHNYNPRFPEIQRALNARMDAPMVQHAGEAQFTHLSEQPIHVFFPRTGPNGEDYSQFDPVIWLNQLTAETWYREWFGGRQAARTSPPNAPRRQFETPAQVIRVDFNKRRRLS
jgi:hypothetical protein